MTIHQIRIHHIEKNVHIVILIQLKKDHEDSGYGKNHSNTRPVVEAKQDSFDWKNW